MLSVPEAKLFIDGNLKEKKQIKVPTYFSDVFMAIGNGVGKNGNSFILSLPNKNKHVN